MKKRIVQEILLKAPFAYAHHKIQFDSNKKVVNYINLAFEEMTGLKRKEILGKSVEKILPSITKGSFDWEGFYGKVTILDERHEITCYLEPLDHWYKIIVFSLKQGHFVTLFQNITAEVKQVEILENHREELYREKELFRTTLLSVGDGVVTTARQGVINFINKVAVRITGLEEEEVKSRYFSQVFKMINECTGKEDEDLVAKVLQTGRATGLAYHTLLIDKVERHVPITDSVTPIMDERGQTSGVALVFRDVTKEKEQQERVTYLSYFDSLTGLYNRRFMEEELVRLDTSKELPYTIITADINGLKLVNDVFGHEEGDKILKKAAEIIQKSCRKGDLIARWGEDEFLALLYNIGADTAENIIDRIKIRCQNGDPNSTKVMQ